MKKSRLAIVLTLVAFLIVFTNTIIISNPSGAPSGRTNSPADGATCNSGGCHGGTPSTSTTILSSNIPANGYTANTSYTFTVTVPGINNKGFEVSPQKNDGTLVGTLTAGTGNHLVATKYVTQSSTKSSNPGVWTFKWKSPAQGSGDVNFYGCFVNGRFSELITQVLAVKENVSASITDIAEQSIQVFPNPINGDFNIYLNNISSDKLTVEIYDLSGKKVAQVYNGSFTNIVPVHGYNLNNGMYILNISTGNKTYCKRIVINN